MVVRQVGSSVPVAIFVEPVRPSAVIVTVTGFLLISPRQVVRLWWKQSRVFVAYGATER